MMAGLSVYTLYVELAHHYMFDTTEDSCFCNNGVCYGYGRYVMEMAENVTGIMAEYVKYTGREIGLRNMDN